MMCFGKSFRMVYSLTPPYNWLDSPFKRKYFVCFILLIGGEDSERTATVRSRDRSVHVCIADCTVMLLDRTSIHTAVQG